MDEREILAKNLKRYRSSKGLSQEKLGKKVGLRGETISNIELAKQRSIGLRYLVLISRELNIGLEELFIKNPDSIPIKLVISDENVQALKEVFNQFKNIMDKK